MSKLRSVNTHFWNDNYIIDLDPLEKLLFLYLLTNPNTNMLGIYELHVRKIAFETGIDKDMVLKIFERFTEAEKVKYKDGYVILQNFLKNQSFNGNMQTSAVKSWNELPLSIREDTFCKPIVKGLKAFDKGSEPIAEIEYEYERELEVESEEELKTESENVSVSTDVTDVPNASDTETWESANRVAEYLLDAICESDPTHKYNKNPPSLKGWVKDIDKAIRLDGRTEEQMLFLVNAVFRDCHKYSELWDKWHQNIQSGNKLRDKFDKIKNEIKSSHGQSINNEIKKTEQFLSSYQE